MAKEDMKQGEGDREPVQPSDDAEWTNAVQMEDNKENQVDNKLFSETEKNEKTEKVDNKSDALPSVDIDKVSADLLHSRTELLGRVHSLKKDLQDWRGKLDSQVKTYRQELGELRTTLNSEVEQLRSEFQALRTTLKRQLDATNGLTELGPNSSPDKVTTS